MRKIKFGIIGCGRISFRHIEALVDNNSEAKLVGICDIIPEKMDNTIEYYNMLNRNRGYKEIEDIKKYWDYKEMLVSSEIDAVIITTDSGCHAKHSIDCLKSRKHVLVEKPMALSIKDADEMIRVSKENKVKLGVCYQNRFSPLVLELKDAVEEGRFGQLINGTTRILWNRNKEYYLEAPWRKNWELGGGALINQCIHNIDLLQWIIGSEVESLFSEIDTFISNTNAEDFAVIIIRFKNGAIGIVEGNLCVYPKNLEETLSIFGEKGTVVIGGSRIDMVKEWIFEDGKEREKKDVEKPMKNLKENLVHNHGLLLNDFIDAIKEDRDPRINGEEGKKSLEIVLGAYLSKLLRRKIEFPIKDVDIDNLMRNRYEM